MTWEKRNSKQGHVGPEFVTFWSIRTICQEPVEQSNQPRTSIIAEHFPKAYSIYSNVFLSRTPHSRSISNSDIGAFGRPLSRQSGQTHIDRSHGLLGAQTMPGGPLVLQGIRTDHTNHPGDHTSGLCESADDRWPEAPMS